MHPGLVLPLGDPRLRAVSIAVDLDDPALPDERRRLHAALAAFRAGHGFGRAIAAPQLGLGKRFIAADLGDGPITLHNPEIVWRGRETLALWDDCMCFPDLLVRVRRAASISVSYLDEHGQLHSLDHLEPRLAELLQHEIDHLDGVLALDRAAGLDAVISRAAYAANPDYFRDQVDLPPL
jgi:branched-chain amino acid aminotransferase